jgi:hypothetical protein
MPTALSALVGQHLRPGYKISAKSGTGLALNIAISGYISTP